MANTRVGVFNTRVDTPGEVSNTHMGVAKSRLGVFNTFLGVSDTRADTPGGDARRRSVFFSRWVCV